MPIYKELRRILTQFGLADIRISPAVVEMARELTQDVGITMLYNMNYMALHAKRQTVSPKDLKIAMKAATTMNFYKLLRNM